MLSEYQARTLGTDRIEMFFPGEESQAAYFEALLREFCEQEQIPKRWHRKKHEAGHLFFHSVRINALLDKDYRELSGWSSIERKGTVNPALMLAASREDQLRFVRGCYERSGTGPPEWSALFGAPNESHKFALLAEVLRRLGCRNVRVYNDYESGNTPTSYVLTFTPTAEIKSLTGIRREVTPAELRKWNDLKEQDAKKLLQASQ